MHDTSAGTSAVGEPCARLPPMSRLAFLVQELEPAVTACKAASPRPAFDACLLRILLCEPPPKTLLWNGRREAAWAFPWAGSRKSIRTSRARR